MGGGATAAVELEHDHYDDASHASAVGFAGDLERAQRGRLVDAFYARLSEDIAVIVRSTNSVTRRAASRSAFTLLELIVAMLMVSIMAASLFAGMRIAFRSQSSAEVAIEPVRTAAVAMEFLREDLQ